MLVLMLYAYFFKSVLMSSVVHSSGTAQDFQDF